MTKIKMLSVATPTEDDLDEEGNPIEGGHVEDDDTKYGEENNDY